MGKRKPFDAILEAFSRVDDERLRLLVRGQVERKLGPLGKAAERDPRIEIELEDRPTDEHLRQFASCDVCLSPSRWEGLGLPLYEAIAFGIPAITNDAPPMNEVVRDGENCALVRSVPWGEARSGIPAFDPDVDALANAIERLAHDSERERLAAGARELRTGERSWERTVAGFADLLDRAGASG
jgi:glycosyltransferase involved in cell wall biosynthesis